MTDLGLIFMWFIVVLSVVVFAVSLWILWPMVIGAQWVPTPRRVVERMLSFAEVGPDDRVYDLGSGDGRIIFRAALKFGANSVGIEADPIRFLFTRIWINWKGLSDRVNVIWGNFFKVDLSKATVITVYQSTEINRKLKDKLLRDLRTGARVISYSFKFDGWEPIKVDENTKLFLYEMKPKAQVDG